MTRVVCICLALLVAAPVHAEALPDVICAPSPDMKAKLKLQFGARQLGSGLQGPEEMIEIWHSESSGDWTLVRSYANGISCIIAMGEHFALTNPPADPV